LARTTRKKKRRRKDRGRKPGGPGDRPTATPPPALQADVKGLLGTPFKAF
jgi:hypothetical protein